MTWFCLAFPFLINIIYCIRRLCGRISIQTGHVSPVELNYRNVDVTQDIYVDF